MMYPLAHLCSSNIPAGGSDTVVLRLVRHFKKAR